MFFNSSSFSSIVGKSAITIGLLIAIVGCGTTSIIGKDEKLSIIQSEIRDPSGDFMYVRIGRINGKNIWPASSSAKIAPGPTSVILLGAKTSMGAFYGEGAKYEFKANPGRRYHLLPGGMIASSDATQSNSNGAIYKVGLLPLHFSNKALIQSATTIDGKDTFEYKNKSAVHPSLIHIYQGMDDGYYNTPNIQLGRELISGKRTMFGRLAGSRYLVVDAGKTYLIAMKQCDQCKIFAVYKIKPEKGKRYELTPQGGIYVSDAFNDNITRLQANFIKNK
jgi:hypothetical protein